MRPEPLTPAASPVSAVPALLVSADAARAATGLAQLVLGQRSLDEMLEVIVEIAKGALAGASEVSITLLAASPVTVASSGALALELDEQQYGIGHGPCLDAARLGEVVTVNDMSLERRWPEYTPRAVQAGVVAALAVPLPIEGRHAGAMNVYYDARGRPDEETARTAVTVAAFVAVALANADRYEKSETLARQLGIALESRAVIDQAKGILMAGHHISADEAFAMLVRLSQHANRKLRDVAAALVERTENGS